MPLDASVVAGLVGVAGVLLGKFGDVVLDRLKATDAKRAGLTQYMGEQQKILFEQQNTVLRQQWERLDALDRERQEAEDRAQLAETKAARYDELERAYTTVAANFADCSRRLAMALAGYAADDEPSYPLPRIRLPRGLPPPQRPTPLTGTPVIDVGRTSREQRDG